MNIQFGTKAETLKRLSTVLKKFIILPQVCFTVDDWEKKLDECIKRIYREFAQEYTKVIIRSSVRGEDSEAESCAGRFKSIGDVDLDNHEKLIQAVEEVIRSYQEYDFRNNQILVQPFLEDVIISGVIFTRDLDTLSPYYLVNYDEISKRSDSVTSGCFGNLRTLVKFHEFPTGDERFIDLFKAIKELERCLECDSLDIEFAIDSWKNIYLLQVRPIVHSARKLLDAEHLDLYLNKLSKKITKLKKPHPYLHGARTLFGIMPDWNPAEMIGVKPRPLALSLYKQLITDRTWAYQRDNYGYRNLRSFPLLITFLGHPYIDVRVSFNSFIPKNLDDDISERLANYYLDCLRKNQKLHDKVEFDIVFSCYFLNISEKLNQLLDAGFSTKDIEKIKESLLSLTNDIIRKEGSAFYNDLERIEYLRIRQKKILCSELSILEKIYWLIEDCCRYGTLPFAGIARGGFIAVQLLRSFVSADVITCEEMQEFMASLNTIAKKLSTDHFRMEKSDFLEEYGHLRPGTYDILSLRYDEAFDLYFREKVAPTAAKNHYSFCRKTCDKINRALNSAGLQVDTAGMIQFLRKAIEGREYAKFVFTKSVSEVLSLIKQLTLNCGLSIDDASFFNISTIMHLYATLDHRDLLEILKEEADRNKHFFEITKQIKLPSVINSPDDIFEFELEEDIPNFITLQRCQGETIGEDEVFSQDLTGKIIFIKGADPGYDWLFSKNIGALITMFGGANSHMAIRCAELKIPAAIGVGEKNFFNWNRAAFLEVDCENRQVKILR